MLKVVSNSSPIIHLNKIGYVHLLENLYKRVYITDHVFEECTGGSFLSPEVSKEIEHIRKISFFEIKHIKNIDLFLSFSKLVDEGEASAIALALENKANLILLDDREAKELADIYNLNYTGTIGVLLKAKEVGLIDDSVPEILEKLKESGFYVSKKLEDYILAKYM